MLCSGVVEGWWEVALVDMLGLVGERLGTETLSVVLGEEGRVCMVDLVAAGVARGEEGPASVVDLVTLDMTLGEEDLVCVVGFIVLCVTP